MLDYLIKFKTLIFTGNSSLLHTVGGFLSPVFDKLYKLKHFIVQMINSV